MFKKCIHKWTKVSDIVTKSPFEVAMSAMNGKTLSNVKIPHQMCHTNRKHILVLTCDHCGQIEKMVTDIP